MITEQRVNKMLSRAIQICNGIVAEQIRQIDRLNTSKCLSWYILDGLQQNIIQPVSEKKVRKKKLPEYYYVCSNIDEVLYMTTDTLYRYFAEQTPIFPTSTIDMDKRLVEEGVIHPRKEKRVATKKIDGHRYLELRRVDLINAVNQTP